MLRQAALLLCLTTVTVTAVFTSPPCYELNLDRI